MSLPCLFATLQRIQVFLDANRPMQSTRAAYWSSVRCLRRSIWLPVDPLQRAGRGWISETKRSLAWSWIRVAMIGATSPA